MVLILSISLNNASIIMANKPVIKSNHKNIDWLRIWQLWSLKKRHTSFYFLGTSVSSPPVQKCVSRSTKPYAYDQAQDDKLQFLQYGWFLHEVRLTNGIFLQVIYFNHPQSF